jgi:hypothetical protein
MAFHAGFDILQYPGTAMGWLKANTNLVWCGYYLAPAPNRQTSPWKGTLAAIRQTWGVLPIYVGQQDPSTGHGSYVPSSILTKAQGAIDGTAACTLVANEGFARGSFVYLDWESGGLGAAGTDYIAAWISTVAADGRAQPGIYCSHVIAQAIANLISAMKPAPNVRFFCWKVPNANAHPFTGNISSLPEIDPAGCGFAGAQSWQREQQAIVTFPNGAPVHSLTMDFSTSSLADPGLPAVGLADNVQTIAAGAPAPAPPQARRARKAKMTGKAPAAKAPRRAKATKASKKSAASKTRKSSTSRAKKPARAKKTKPRKTKKSKRHG